ncbi:DUF2141 domain-containing protein [Flavobacterium gelatinilyticum]|uniref:DUF2141 domain-containing protein n=1 Tax=Flavobacterium gelatinilyticum TaxID=3003260 RepID=UPI0024812F10|nr:DUF2141 domain-containing protein [Flavobacterium gelatinilyticum]
MADNPFPLRSIFILTALLFISSAACYGQNLHLLVSGMRSEKGNIILNVFKDKESYSRQQPFKKLIFEKNGPKGGTMIISFDLNPALYGITLVDDENKDGQLNKNFLGIPKEGFGFSNFFMEKMKKPDFDDFKTAVKSTGNKIAIRVKYM